MVARGHCLGYVQKRVGGRLRTLRSTFQGKLYDGKRLGGAGRLTEKMINTLQNHYGVPIRQNSNTSVYEMKRAIGAVLFHCSEARNSSSLLPKIRKFLVQISSKSGNGNKCIQRETCITSCCSYVCMYIFTI